MPPGAFGSFVIKNDIPGTYLRIYLFFLLLARVCVLDCLCFRRVLFVGLCLWVCLFGCACLVVFVCFTCSCVCFVCVCVSVAVRRRVVSRCVV